MASPLDALRAQYKGSAYDDMSDLQIVEHIANQNGMHLAVAARQYGVELPSIESNTGAAWESGKSGYGQGVGHIAAWGGKALGIQGVERWGKNFAADQEVAGRYADSANTDPQRIEDVESLSDFGGYLRSGAVKSVPYLAEFGTFAAADALTGGALTPAIVARYAGRAAPIVGRSAIERQVAESGASNLVTQQAAREAATRGVARGIERTAMLPVVTYPSSLGDVLGNQYEESGTYDSPSALLAAAGYSGLNAVGGIEGAMARGLPVSLLESRVKRAVSGAASMGVSGAAQEVGQEVFNQAARMGVNPEATLTSGDAPSRYLNSAVLGGLLEGTPGAVAGAVSKAPSVKAQESRARLEANLGVDLLEAQAEDRVRDPANPKYVAEMVEGATIPAELDTASLINESLQVGQKAPSRTDAKAGFTEKLETPVILQDADGRAFSTDSAYHLYLHDNAQPIEPSNTLKYVQPAPKAGLSPDGTLNLKHVLGLDGIGSLTPKTQAWIVKHANGRTPSEFLEDIAGADLSNAQGRVFDAMMAAYPEALQQPSIDHNASPILTNKNIPVAEPAAQAPTVDATPSAGNELPVPTHERDLGELAAALVGSSEDPTPVGVSDGGHNPTLTSALSKVEATLAPQQKKVFGVLMAAAQENRLDDVITSDGKLQFQNIASLAGITSRSGAQAAINQTLKKISTGAGFDVKEYLRSNTKFVRQEEQADATRLGLAPSQQDTRAVDVGDVFGDDGTQSMSDVKSVGSRVVQEDLEEVPVAVAVEETAPNENAVAAAYANRKAYIQEVLNSPETEQAKDDFNDYKPDGVKPLEDHSVEDQFEFISDYLEMLDAANEYEWDSYRVGNEVEKLVQSFISQRDTEKNYGVLPSNVTEVVRIGDGNGQEKDSGQVPGDAKESPTPVQEGRARGQTNPTEVFAKLRKLSTHKTHGAIARSYLEEARIGKGDINVVAEWVDSVAPKKLTRPKKTAAVRASTKRGEKSDINLLSNLTNDDFGRPVSPHDADKTFARIVGKWSKASPAFMHDTFSSAPEYVKQAVRDSGGNEKTAGVYVNGEVHVIRDNHSSVEALENTLYHEGNHSGMIRELNSSVMKKLNQAGTELGGEKGLSTIADNYGLADRFAEYVRDFEGDPNSVGMLTAELSALLSERHKFQTVPMRIRLVLMRAIGAVRSFLRASGFVKLSAKNEADLLHLVAKANARLKKADGGASDAPALRSNLVGTTSTPTQRKVLNQITSPTGRLVLNNTVHTLGKMAKSTMFLHDLVAEFKDRLPAIKPWYDSMVATLSTRKHLEAKAEEIALMAAKLPNGTGAVNEYLGDSTYMQKWGYDPKLPGKTVSVDPEFRIKFTKLLPEEREVVKAVFAHGESMRAERDKILDGLKLKTVFTPTGRLDGPYAPLKRFGGFVATLKSKELVEAEKRGVDAEISKLKSDSKHYVMSQFDSIGLAKKFAESQDIKNGGKYHLTDAFEGSPQVERQLPQAVLQRVLSAIKMDDSIPATARQAVEKLVSDMYLASIDEHSARTSGAKRLNRAGFEPDMMRSFLSHARAEAGLLATLKHGQTTSEHFIKAGVQAKNETTGKRDGQDVFNTMAEHYAESLNFKDTPWQDRAMALTSAWQLATSIGYHVTNLMQGVMVTIPKLAADFNNYSGAWDALMNAYGTLRTTGVSGALKIDAIPNPGVRATLKLAADRGLLDVGMDEDLSQFEATKTGIGAVDKASSVAKKALHLLRQTSRKVEIANRVASSVAAYNLAIQHGKSEQAAQEYAIEILATTQGDVSRLSAPLLLKKLPKIVTQYRKYQFMMMALYIKAFRDAFGGATPEIQAVGRRMLAFKLFHTSVVAGALGMPVMNILGQAFAFFGDDDDPNDLERSLREVIGDEDIATLLLHGPVALAGLDMSGKLGDDKIFSVIPYGEWDFSSAEGLKNTAASLAGPAFSQATRFADGVGLLQSGDLVLGTEKLMPKGVADAMRAFRIANEGYTLKSGAVLFGEEEINEFALVLDALGMPSTEMKRMDWLRNQRYEVREFYEEASDSIKAAYLEAVESGDVEAAADAKDKWLELQSGKAGVMDYLGDAGMKIQPLSILLKYPKARADALKETKSSLKRDL